MTTSMPTSAPPRIGAFPALVGAELRMVVRDTAGLVIPIGLPILILVMNGLGIEDAVLPGTDGLTVFDVYVLPLVLAVVVATIGVVNMPSFLATYRKSGVLKRLAVTPARPSLVLGAQVAVSLAQTLVGVVLAVAIAMLMFGAGLPRNLALAVGVFALTAGAMYAIGLVIAAVVPTANSAVAVGLVVFFAMGALGGMFGPVTNLPPALAEVGTALPFGAAVQAMSAAWVGNVPDLASIVSLVVTLVVGGAFATRFFRWS
ncbi:ABC transporter permease [Agromyces atrinae]|uniref:Transport permease protein n=1 Tax=Agromyces atrinae TaxID=592376 RepID=A0A4Q2M728_9MICO|nr:ABC transporter permease [Agromyces atrinae]NYD68493.1 ABC-2 type transport system permease protein [Agromyces atrinae]RXZ84960.1 ABC transporter permease [Agromyces atrinae]